MRSIPITTAIGVIAGVLLFTGGLARAGTDARKGPVRNSIEMDLAWIPAGQFTMGSPSDEPGRLDVEIQHKVTLTKGFYMGTTPVTQAQWRKVMGSSPSHFKGDNLPVEQVSWEEAVEFCRKLSRTEGKLYRLPTEAEWEYACRAGSTGAYGGTGKLDKMGWYSRNSDGKTHPVGTKQANAWGLFDMHGNVWQWCGDWFGDYTPKEAINPTGPPTGNGRLLRGGSWNYAQQFCRSAVRNGGSPVNRRNDIGFRIVLELPE